MPDLTTFHYLRWATYPSTAQTFLQGSETPEGPWHRLTKRETRTVLALAQAEAAKQNTVAPTPHST